MALAALAHATWWSTTLLYVEYVERETQSAATTSGSADAVELTFFGPVAPPEPALEPVALPEPALEPVALPEPALEPAEPSLQEALEPDRSSATVPSERPAVPDSVTQAEPPPEATGEAPATDAVASMQDNAAGPRPGPGRAEPEGAAPSHGPKMNFRDLARAARRGGDYGLGNRPGRERAGLGIGHGAPVLHGRSKHELTELGKLAFEGENPLVTLSSFVGDNKKLRVDEDPAAFAKQHEHTEHRWFYRRHHRRFEARETGPHRIRLMGEAAAAVMLHELDDDDEPISSERLLDRLTPDPKRRAVLSNERRFALVQGKTYVLIVYSVFTRHALPVYVEFERPTGERHRFFKLQTRGSATQPVAWVLTRDDRHRLRLNAPE